ATPRLTIGSRSPWELRGDPNSDSIAFCSSVICSRGLHCWREWTLISALRLQAVISGSAEFLMVHGCAGCTVPWLYGAMLQRSSDLRIFGSFRRSEIADDASRRVCKGCYNLGHGRLSPLLKRFYAGFYCWKAVHSDGRLRASSRARRAGPHPGNLPSEQPRGTRRSFCVRLRRPRDGARVR